MQTDQPRNERLEGVADEDAEHDRDEDFTRPVEQRHGRRGGNDDQRDAAELDVDRRRCFGSGCAATNRVLRVGVRCDRSRTESRCESDRHLTPTEARPARACSALLIATRGLRAFGGRHDRRTARHARHRRRRRGRGRCV